jgi:hypothetical protein
MTEPRKRRWFQFSLRTLLIGVTLLGVACGYVAWQAKIVRGREAILKHLIDGGGGYFRVSIGPSGHKTYSVCGDVPIPENGKWLVPSHEYEPPSWIRRWLGDECICAIWLPESFTAADVCNVADYFPEAGIGQRSKQSK